MSEIKIIIAVLYLLTLVVAFVLYKILTKTVKDLNECRLECEKLKGDLEWEKIKAQVSRDVQNEIKKKNKVLETGTKNDRINAAGNILSNGKGAKRDT